MKKTLIALAAVAATGAAFAQSSVTLYGVADVSLGKVSANGTLGYTDDAQLSSNGILNNGSSRLGFRGVEDLGGGLKAGFNFEQGINLESGATDAPTFQRAANMSVMGNFGEIRLGRSLTTTFYSVAAWELTGTANYSVVGKQFGYGAGARYDAAIMYFSPSMGGFKVGASTNLKGNTGADARYDLSLGYAAGPLATSFAYTTQKNAVQAYSLGAKYDFGGFVVAGSLNDSEFEATGVTIAKGFSLGGTAKLGAVSLTLDVARDTEAKDTDLLVEAKYPLSKRTFVYAVVLRDGKGKQATNETGYAVGVRHNF